MKKSRDILILLFVAGAFGITLNLFRQAVGYKSPWFVLIVMFDFLGLVAFARSLFLLPLPQFLQEVRTWEADGRLYRAVGVPAFGVLLSRTPLRYLQPLVYLNRSPRNPLAVQNQIKGAEAAHFWAGALIIPYMIYACTQNWWSVVAWFTVVQIIGNLYPILHLRWVRGRLKRFLDRKLQTK
jgi:hypothetical protein